MSGSQYFTADGVVGVIGRPCRVFSVHLLSGGTASTTTLKNGTTTSGTVYVQLDGTISKGTTFNAGPAGIRFPGGCFVDVDANATSVLVEFENEL